MTVGGLPLNQLVQADALTFATSLPDASLDVWWSSPPYNLADPFRGGNPRLKERYRPHHRYGTARGDGCLQPEADYQAEQIEVLKQWHRTLRPNGIAFYSHKVRIRDGRAISPLEWLFKTPFVLLQEVVWDRRGSPNVDPIRFLPVSERIYLLTKRPGIRLHNPQRLPDVLSIDPSHHKRADSGHPCPTHPSIVRACLSVVPRPAERRLLVADCYGGIGTTFVVAAELGMDYLGCDIVRAYVEAARSRLTRTATLPLPLNAYGQGCHEVPSAAPAATRLSLWDGD